MSAAVRVEALIEVLNIANCPSEVFSERPDEL